MLFSRTANEVRLRYIRMPDGIIMPQVAQTPDWVQLNSYIESFKPRTYIIHTAPFCKEDG